MEEPVMKSLYEFNTRFPEREFSRQARQTKDPTQWAGKGIRCMLMLLYILAFMCLLRYDEALRIRWSDLILTGPLGHSNGRPYYRLEVNLPFRKTHQTGGTPTKQIPLRSAILIIIASRYTTVLSLL